MLSTLAAASLLVPLAGCDSTSSEPDVPAAPAPSASAVPSAAAVPASPAAIPGLRPMTPAEKQRRDLCQRGIVKNGCEFFTDDALRLQGIDPDS